MKETMIVQVNQWPVMSGYAAVPIQGLLASKLDKLYDKIGFLRFARLWVLYVNRWHILSESVDKFISDTAPYAPMDSYFMESGWEIEPTELDLLNHFKKTIKVLGMLKENQ